MGESKERMIRSKNTLQAIFQHAEGTNTNDYSKSIFADTSVILQNLAESNKKASARAFHTKMSQLLHHSLKEETILKKNTGL